MKFLFTLLIILSTLSCFVKSQFINFVPYQDYQCSSSPYGYGYSISTTQDCIYNLGNGPLSTPYSYSASFGYMANETYIRMNIYNYSDTACQNPVSEFSMLNNSCSSITFLPKPFNGTVVGSDYQYSFVFVSNEPVYATNSIVFSQYQQPDFNVCSNNDLVFSTTISTGLKVVNGEYSTSYLCNDHIPYINNCIGRVNCKLSNVSLSCNQAGNINNQVNYC
ncbi:hypothetical protein ACTFIV_005523 [Dictyostelium citrinum]